MEFDLIEISIDPLNPNFADPFYFESLAIKNITIPPISFFFKENLFFSSLLNTITIQEFEKDYWEKNFFYTKNANLKSILDYSTESLENDLTFANLGFSTLSVSQDSWPIDMKQFVLTNGSLNEVAKKFYKLPDTSLRLTGIHEVTKSESLIQAVRDISCATQLNCGAVLFYSSPFSSALPTHWDTENIFIIQLEGEKVWEFSETNFPLPTDFQSPAVFKGKHVTARDQGYRITLKKGDILYLPKGWLHKAIATDSYSLHVTIGVFAPNWFDMLNFACQNALLRTSLDSGVRCSINSFDGKGVEYLKEQYENFIKNFSFNDFQECFRLWKNIIPKSLKEFRDPLLLENQYLKFMLGTVGFRLIKSAKIELFPNSKSKISQIFIGNFKIVGKDQDINAIYALLTQASFKIEDLKMLIGTEKCESLVRALAITGKFEEVCS